MDTLKLKKAWEVALAPAKGLPMTAIMMYMSGNSLQIFSIMMVFMAFKNPVMGLIGTNTAFERFESDTNKGAIVQPKLAYVAMQLLALGLGLWKIDAMGLLPYVIGDAEPEPLPPANCTANNEAGPRGRIGWLGSRSGNHWSLLSQRYRMP